MGVLTDIIVAHESEAEAVVVAHVPCEEWAGFDAKGIDQLKLEALLELIAPTSPSSEKADFRLLAQADDEGPWVERLPLLLQQRLSTLSATELTEIARKWSETEPFREENWDTATVTEVLTQLRECAVKAVFESKVLLMWISL